MDALNVLNMHLFHTNIAVGSVRFRRTLTCKEAQCKVQCCMAGFVSLAVCYSFYLSVEFLSQTRYNFKGEARSGSSLTLFNKSHESCVLCLNAFSLTSGCSLHSLEIGFGR